MAPHAAICRDFLRPPVMDMGNPRAGAMHAEQRIAVMEKPPFRRREVSYFLAYRPVSAVRIDLFPR